MFREAPYHVESLFHDHQSGPHNASFDLLFILTSTEVRQWAGLHALMAVRAGARHVTAVERWLYLSLAAKQSFIANGGAAQHLV